MASPNQYMQRKYMARHRQRKREARLQEQEARQREREALQPEPEPHFQQFEELCELPPPKPQPKKVPKTKSTERVRAFRERKKLLGEGRGPKVEKHSEPKARKTSTERVKKFRLRKKLLKGQTEPEVQVQFVPNVRGAVACDPLAAVKVELTVGESSDLDCPNPDPLLVSLKYGSCVESDTCQAIASKMARSKHLQRKYGRAYRQRQREARLRELEARQALSGQPLVIPSPVSHAERMREYRLRKKLKEQAEPKQEFEYQKRIRMKMPAEPEVEVHFVPNDSVTMACDPLAIVKLELPTDECTDSDWDVTKPNSETVHVAPMDPVASTSVGAVPAIKQELCPELSTPALDGFFGPAALWESLQNVPDPVAEQDQEGAPRGRKNPTVTLDSLKKELTYECELCGKRFRKSADFFQHKLTHGEELKCADCDERFFRTWDLEKHRVEKHSDSEIHKCDICSKTFIEHWRLLRHQRTHTTEKKFKCDMCDKSFTESGNLAKHKKQVHTKDRPFACEICSKSYPQKKDLQGHMLVHTMKRFSCKICQEEFSLLDEKRKHMRELHPNETVEKTFTCTVCEATFNSKLKHSSHVLTHGERRFECQFCMKKFHTNARVRKHMKSHQVELYSKCHICDKCFSQDCNLKRHIEQMHMQGDRYSCLHCTSLFDSADELRGHRESEHQNELPYKCPVCPKAFSFHQSLVNHAKCHNNAKRHLQEFIKPTPRKRKQPTESSDGDGTEVVVKKRGRPKKKLAEATEFVDLMETVMLNETVPIKVEYDAGEQQQQVQLDSSALVSEIKVENTSFNETETTEEYV